MADLQPGEYSIRVCPLTGYNTQAGGVTGTSDSAYMVANPAAAKRRSRGNKNGFLEIIETPVFSGPCRSIRIAKRAVID